MIARMVSAANVGSQRAVNVGARRYALGGLLLLAACGSTHADGPREPARVSLASAPRMVPVASACRGARLTLDGAMLDGERSPCSCSERDVRTRPDGRLEERAGTWCGPAHASETRSADVSALAERTVLAPGEGTRVTLRVRNPSAQPAVYRLATRHLSARFVLPSGAPLEDAALSSGPYNDEALFELEAGGSLEITLQVRGTYSRHARRGQGATVDDVPLAPGAYAIQVFTGGLGGVDSKLVPVEVR